MRVLRLSKDEFKRMSIGSQTRYVYLTTAGWRIEPLQKLSKRTEMWEWMVACLRKGKEKGPFSHLADQVSRYDVAGLYTSILESVDIQNPFVFWRAFEDFVVSKPDKGEDIFAYFARLDKMVTGLTIQNPEEVGALGLLDWSQTWLFS